MPDMLKKTLHAGNIVNAIAAVATAADLSLTGGMGLTISAALSGTELFKKSTSEQKNMAKEMAKMLESHLAATHLTDDRRKIVAQMLDAFPPSETDIAEGNMQAETIAANMCDRIKETNTDPEYRTDTALGDYKTLLCELIAPFLLPKTQIEANVSEVLKRTAPQETAKKERDAEFRQMMMRHQFEEVMEESGSSYSEMTSLLLDLQDKKISISEAKRIIFRNHR